MPRTFLARPFLGVLLAFCCFSLPAHAANQTALVQLVEYVGADYINAVVDGEIVSPAEYAEMSEFSVLLAEGVAELPEAEGKQMLQAQASDLQQAVTGKAAESEIKALAQSIRATLVSVYGIPVSPKQAPDQAHMQRRCIRATVRPATVRRARAMALPAWRWSQHPPTLPRWGAITAVHCWGYTPPSPKGWKVRGWPPMAIP